MTPEERRDLFHKLFKIGWDTYINENNGYRAPEQLVESALIVTINAAIDHIQEMEDTKQ